MSEVRLGVDVNVFRRMRAGIARYLKNMLVCILESDRRIVLFLYAAGRVSVSLPSGRWELRHAEGWRDRLGSIWLQKTCPRWMAEDRVDFFWGQHLVPLRLRRPCRRLLSLHDLTEVLFPQTMSLGSRFACRAFLRQSIQAADWILADSQSTARQAISLFRVDRGLLRIAYPGLENVFAPVERERAVRTVADRFRLPASYLLTVGTLEPRKAHLLLLDALASLPEAPPLVIAGGLGWNYRPILSRIRDMEASGRVRYLGYVKDDDLPSLYSAARVTVIPSLYEGFGMPVLEAMACGSPVLASWTSSLPEVGGDAARYFRRGDVRDLTVQLAELLGDQDELERMAAAGKERAAKFSFRNAADQLLGLVGAR